MSIQRQTFRGKELITVEGVVSAFYINEIPADQIKTYGDKGWTPTHRYTVVVDGVRIGLGMGDKDGVSDRQIIQAKDNDGNWHAITKGVKVNIEVEEGKEYKGVMQYNSAPAKVVILDASGAQAPTPKSSTGASSGGAAQPFKPKDTSGIRVGHSLNGAFAYLLGNGIDFDYETDGTTVAIAKMVNDVTENMVAAYKAKNPGMSEYDVGAATGNSVLNACRIIPETPKSEFKDVLTTTANALLYNVVPAITEYVKKDQETKPTKASPPAAKKAVSKAKPVVKPLVKEQPVDETVEDDRPITGFDDMDDDIPFN